jgi:hypothetical protein
VKIVGPLKAFLETHTSSEENNKAFPFISEAFEKEKSVAECTNAAALGASNTWNFLSLPN